VLKKIAILPGKISDWDAYPFSVPAIRDLRELKLRSRICFFAGENGTGKSTLLEAIAAHYGFGREGGNRSFHVNTTESNHSIDPLVLALRLSFDVRTGKGFFLRAESFFNTASYIDAIGATGTYDGCSLHNRSHGESFLTVLQHRFQADGLFLLDEPEAALSPQRQLAFLVLIHDVLKKHKNAQFIISSHSPVLLGYPRAQLFSFDEGHIHEVAYEDIPATQVVRRFLVDRNNFLERLLGEAPSLLEDL
jgi:predicted ATPase